LRTALNSVAAADIVRAEALEACGELEWMIGDYSASGGDLTEALRLWRTLGDPSHQGRVLDMLGVQAHFAGNVEAGSRHFEESSVLLLKGGDPWRRASLLNNMGYLAHQRGDGSGSSDELVNEALLLARESGDLWMTCLVLDSLASIEFDTHNHQGARRHWSECLTTARELGDLGLASYVVEGVARLLIAQGNAERAFELFGAAESIREMTGVVRDPYWEAVVADSLADAAIELRGDIAEVAATRGANMSADDAIALALAQVSPTSAQ
jgi:tetratricopeptide (TPR) repeat protein